MTQDRYDPGARGNDEQINPNIVRETTLTDRYRIDRYGPKKTSAGVGDSGDRNQELGFHHPTTPVTEGIASEDRYQPEAPDGSSAVHRMGTALRTTTDRYDTNRCRRILPQGNVSVDVLGAGDRYREAHGASHARQDGGDARRRKSSEARPMDRATLFDKYDC